MIKSVFSNKYQKKERKERERKRKINDKHTFFGFVKVASRGSVAMKTANGYNIFDMKMGKSAMLKRVIQLGSSPSNENSLKAYVKLRPMTPIK